MVPPLLWETTSELWCLFGGKRGDYQNCSVLYCVLKMCTVISTLRWAVLTVLWIGFCHTGPISLCISVCVLLWAWWCGPDGIYNNPSPIWPIMWDIKPCSTQSLRWWLKVSWLVLIWRAGGNFQIVGAAMLELCAPNKVRTIGTKSKLVFDSGIEMRHFNAPTPMRNSIVYVCMCVCRSKQREGSQSSTPCFPASRCEVTSLVFLQLCFHLRAVWWTSTPHNQPVLCSNTRVMTHRRWGYRGQWLCPSMLHPHFGEQRIFSGT